MYDIMNENMKTSAHGLTFISKWEGTVLKPYKDIAGLRTIGVGHLILPGENFPDGVSITSERALEILSQDLKKCEDAIKKKITVPLNQNQFDALVSFGFNCGTGVYSKSGVADALKVSNYSAVPEKLLVWSKAKIAGVLQTVPGLLSRRRSEGQLFAKPVVEGVVMQEPDVVNWTEETVTKVQDTLKKMGIYTGPVDGVWTRELDEAAIEFSNLFGVMLYVNTSKGLPKVFFDVLERASE